MTTGDEPSIGGDKRIDTSGAEPKLGGEAAILHMVEMLNHTDRKVRYRAALKLAESGDERVFDTLIEMLQDEDGTPRLRERAAMALGQLGDERAIEPLVAAVGLVPAYYIIKVLVQIGGERAADAVEEVFHDHWDERFVPAVVGNSLAELGEQRVIRLLIIPIENALGFSNNPGFFASGRLKELGSQIIEPLLPLLNHEASNVRQLTLRALSEVNDPRLVEALIALLDDSDPDVVRDAVRLLGGSGDARAVPPLLDLIDHPDQDISEMAVKALGALGDARAIEPLLKALNGPNTRLRGYAGQALVTIGCPDTVKILEKALIESSKQNARDLAIALATIGTDQALQILETAIWHGPSPWGG